MNTIVLSTLLGSDTGAIAKNVAKDLGYDLIDRAILEGTMRQYGLTGFGKVYTTPPNFLDLTNSKNLQVLSMLNDTLQALAQRGRTLILVRGGYVTLNKYEDVLHVRLNAPFRVRTDRVMEREGLEVRAEAEQQVANDDRARTLFVKRFYGRDWHDARDFDLVLNTDLIDQPTVEAWITEALRIQEAKPVRKGAQLARKAKVDPLLVSAINESMMRSA